MTVYFTAGGLLSSALGQHAVQLVVKLAGFAIALPLALAAAGGWTRRRRDAPTRPATYWNPLYSAGRARAGATWRCSAPAFVVSPGLLQKVYGARDDRAVRLGVGAERASACCVFAFVPVAARHDRARHLHPDLANPELALPTLLMRRRCPGHRHPRPGRGVLGRGQHRRRHPVHAVDVAVAGSLQALHQSGGRATAQVLRVARARGASRARSAACCSRCVCPP